MPWQAKVAQPKPEGREGELKSIQFGFVRRSPLSCAGAAQRASPCRLSISSYHLLLADGSDGNLTFQAIKSDGNQLAPPRHAAMRASEQGDKGSDFACSHNRGGGCIHVHGRVHPRQCSASLWSALQFTSSAFAATSAATKRGRRARVSTKSFSTYWAH